jgi:hypothetical protein
MKPLVMDADGSYVEGVYESDAFIFSELALGVYEAFLAGAPDVRQRLVLRNAGERLNVSLSLPPPLVISGRVIDQSGEAVVDAWVQGTNWDALEPTDTTRTALTDVDGTFVLEGVLTGRYSLGVTSGYGRGQREDVRAGARDIILKVESFGSLTGTVSDGDGNPVLFSLSLRRDGDGEGEQVGGRGTWSLPWIPAGSYQLFATSSVGEATSTVVVEPNANVDVPLTLTGGGLPPD